MPEGKVSLELDAQKTYRVFENLFVNLEKYAMPNSRVYGRSRRRTTRCARSSEHVCHGAERGAGGADGAVCPRGDASRNTEGSGLGLAIARSFYGAAEGNVCGGCGRGSVQGNLVWKKDLKLPASRSGIRPESCEIF